MVSVLLALHRHKACSIGLAAAIVVTIQAAPSTVVAQQILICRNLHNDLTNFDRRASTLGTGGTRTTLSTSPDALLHLPDLIPSPPCPQEQAESGMCIPELPGDPNQPMPDQVRYDPVRLRMLELLVKYKCQPYEAYAASPFDNYGAGARSQVRARVRAKY